MIQVNNIYFFITVIEYGGFSEAARKLGVSSAAVSKNIKQLESDLGITLFHRSTRKVTPTDNALILFEKAKNILSGIDEIKNFAAVLQNVPMGTLRISSPMSFAIHILFPFLNEFLTSFPELNADIELNDAQVISLDKEDRDILIGRTMNAIIGHEEDVIGIKLFSTRFVVCASSAYIKKNGYPKDIHDLNGHAYIFHKGRIFDTFLQSCATKGIHLINKVTVNTTEALVLCVKQGIGLGFLPSHVIEEEILAGEIVVLDDVYKDELVDLYMFFRRSRFREEKIVRFKEFVLEKIKGIQKNKRLG